MNWYWKARIYNPEGNYATVFIKTNRDLREIDAIQDFYFELTGCKMLLEGMSEFPPELPANPAGLRGFQLLWSAK